MAQSPQAGAAVSQDKLLTSRLEFVREMKSSKYALQKHECDYVPAMELLGVYAAHATVTRMVARKELELGPGALLNAVLSLHAFNVWHSCSHGGVAQHGEEHQAFENMVCRLAGVVILFDDGSVAGHKRHHRYTNTPDDPDLYMKELPIEELGEAFYQFSQATGPDEGAPGFVWGDQALKLAAGQAVKCLGEQEHTAELAQTLRATWQGSATLSMYLLILFFGRYPHRNGKALAPQAEEVNEVDSFYDTTFRGQGQVDLWMMGEGWHHGHHAVTDVPYTVLPKVGADVEERRPDLKALSRGNDDLAALEGPGSPMPPRLDPAASPPDQRGWERTQAVRAQTELLLSGRSGCVQGALTGLAGIVVENALRVATTADMALLRHLHQRMGLAGREGADATNPLPTATWHETVFAERTQELLRQQGSRIKAQVQAAAQAAGAAVAPTARLSEKADIKECYLELFRALGSACLEPQAVWPFLERYAEAFPPPQAGGPEPRPEALLARLRGFLEAPIPRDSRRPEELRRPKGSPGDALQRIADVLCLRPPRSRL